VHVTSKLTAAGNLHCMSVLSLSGSSVWCKICRNCEHAISWRLVFAILLLFRGDSLSVGYDQSMSFYADLGAFYNSSFVLEKGLESIRGELTML
jgi:hypothetical protein